MLEIQGLSKNTGNIWSGSGYAFQCRMERWGILLGPNGAGKSTIIKSIAGLQVSGTIKIQGHPAKTLEAKRQLRMCRKYRQCLRNSYSQRTYGIYAKGIQQYDHG